MTRALGLLLLLASACGREWERFDVGASGGSAGAGGATPIDGGTCFPGAKACPDQQGNLVCLTNSDPKTGCSGSACSPCFLPHALARCGPTGACEVDKCLPGFQDCNQDPADGCETNGASDPKHCGGCDKDCTAGDGGPDWVCRFGLCFPNQCGTSSLADCDGKPGNLCEVNIASDANNCGFCGKVCALPNSVTACSQGVCVVTECASGWANCDNNDANGCETNLKSDPGNCGGCMKVCDATNGVSGCISGSCAILCNLGFSSCDLNAGNGCEVDTRTSAKHCGGCFKPCNTLCVEGKCL